MIKVFCDECQNPLEGKIRKAWFMAENHIRVIAEVRDGHHLCLECAHKFATIAMRKWKITKRRKIK